MPRKISWHAFYNIPVVHYSPKVVEQLTPAQRQRWKQWQQAFQQLEAAGVFVHLVPLSYDPEAQGFWMDYLGDYVAHEVQNGKRRLEAPHVNVALKIDAQGHLFTDRDIHLHHCDIQGPLKQRVQAIFRPYPWFHWSGEDEETMQIHWTDGVEVAAAEGSASSCSL